MTSFTPQGGGETPKALSSRVLVAAYWLFVVLMLATFTANVKSQYVIISIITYSFELIEGRGGRAYKLDINY